MKRTIRAHNKPPPRGHVPIPGDTSDDGDDPTTDTAPQATFSELQQAAQTGQWNTHGTPPWQLHAPQPAPVGQGHGDQSQQWGPFDGSRNAPHFGDHLAGHQPQFDHGEHVLNPLAPHYQAPQGVNTYSQMPQHDGRQTFMPQYDGRPPHATFAGNVENTYSPAHQGQNWTYQHPSMGNPDMSMMPTPNTWGRELNIQSAPTQQNQSNSNGPAGQGPQ